MCKKNNILVLSKYPRMGASSRLRTLQYLPFLKSKGFDFTVKSLLDDDYLKELYGKGARSRLSIMQCYIKRFFVLFTVFKYDLIWIEKEIFPYFPAIFEKLLSVFSVKYIVDYDDAIFHNYDSSKSYLIRFFLSKKIDKVMRYSQCVIAGNDYLANRAKLAKAKRIEIIPTVIDHFRYKNRKNVIADKLTVGWIGSPSTQKYVVEILPALLEVNLKIPFRLLLVGASSDVGQQLLGLEVDSYSWSEKTEVDLIRTMDIGIMPLHDGPWEKGKCGYKLIQYMACGVTVVASPVGVNKAIVESSSAGIIADTESEWIAALLQSLESSDFRNKSGISGRNTVEEKYSLKSQACNMSAILSSNI